MLVALVLLGVTPASAGAADVPFERSTYNAVETTEAGLVTTLRVTSRPAGLRYTATLDPARTYRVRVRGRTTQNGIVMRIRTDDRLRYLRAPNGLYGARVTGAEQLEILLFRHYASDDEEYRVLEVTAQECVDQCPGDSDLRAEILAARPGLADALANGDRVGAAIEIMHWSAPRTPVAGGTPRLQTQTDGLTAAELWYDQLKTREVGVLCAGAAAFLVKLLDLFDIPSFELDFGDPAVYTHATVVVDGGDATDPEWHLLDPTFDTVLRAPGSGVALPLAPALEAWRAGRSDLIEVDTGSLVGRPIVYDPERDGTPWDLRCDDVATSGWSGCGLPQLANDFDAAFEAAGHGRGYDAMLSLLARGTLFSTEHFGTPPAFQAMHAVLRDALISHDADVHVGELPLPPRNVTPPSLAVDRADPTHIVVDSGAWQHRPGSRDPEEPALGSDAAVVRWLRCGDECAVVAGAAGRSYTVTPADAGTRLMVRVSVANRWGSTSVDTAPIEPAEVPAPVIARVESGPAPLGMSSPPSPTRGAVPHGPALSTPAPPRVRISGIRRVGERLRCVGRGVPATAVISWWRERAGRLVRNQPLYRARPADRGRRISCRAKFGATAARSASVRIRAGRR